MGSLFSQPKAPSTPKPLTPEALNAQDAAQRAASASAVVQDPTCALDDMTAALEAAEAMRFTKGLVAPNGLPAR